MNAHLATAINEDDLTVGDVEEAMRVLTRKMEWVVREIKKDPGTNMLKDLCADLTIYQRALNQMGSIYMINSLYEAEPVPGAPQHDA